MLNLNYEGKLLLGFVLAGFDGGDGLEGECFGGRTVHLPLLECVEGVGG